jgi:hypothetical protein
VALLGLGLASLLPVLPLVEVFNQYGYSLAIVWVGVTTLAWQAGSRSNRAVLGLALAFTVAHGVTVQRFLYRSGELESVLTPALAAHARSTPDAELRLIAADPMDYWTLLRLTHDVPCRHGIATPMRLEVVQHPSEADWIVSRDEIEVVGK